MPSTAPGPDPKPLPQVHFDVDDLDADEEKSLDFFRQVGVREDMLFSLGEHHDGAHSYYVLFDGTATWGVPGMPQLLAVHLHRDYENKTFSFEQAPLPLPAMAQSWLIHRGCPHDAITLSSHPGPPPADAATRALERRLADAGDHYAMGYSYTSDDPDDMVVVVALRALDERAPSPYRVMAEEIDVETWTHTLREGGFDTMGQALEWCEARLDGEAGPLPPVRPAGAASLPVGVAKTAAVPRPAGGVESSARGVRR
ncbi:hypothetical protein [Streptomyces albidoflavus]|uniref:hypothetical protein n=1 Tax=Streptomyces albidoflavus TaxID=1886 RepID=UPI00101E4ED9|nr:hypothetical protein [Streptomyces albidoflavus]RZD82200.1 hypothetical protein C0Q63_22405 [Streptomyces albidoflavus]